MAQAQDPSEKPSAAAETPDEIVVEEAPTGASATATATLTDEKSESTMAGERVVYVAAPMPPKLRSNRVVGSLLALLGAVVFAVVYALIVALLLQLGLLPKVNPESGFGEFIQDAVFWVPVLFFAIGFVLVVLLLNRAAWWLHVLGSLLVAVIVYFGSIAMLLLVTGIAGDQKSFVSIATSAYVLIATFTAREVSIWIGFLIALRGGRVKELNKAAREAFDSEQTATSSTSAKTETDGAAPATA